MLYRDHMERPQWGEALRLCRNRDQIPASWAKLFGCPHQCARHTNEACWKFQSSWTSKCLQPNWKHMKQANYPTERQSSHRIIKTKQNKTPTMLTMTTTTKKTVVLLSYWSFHWHLFLYIAIYSYFEESSKVLGRSYIFSWVFTILSITIYSEMLSIFHKFL